MKITPEEYSEAMKKLGVGGYGGTAVARDAPRAVFFDSMLRQAQVATERLTGDPAWNVFLQRVQAFIAEEEVTLGSLPVQLVNPNLPIESVQQIRVQMVASKARIDAWTKVLSLPNEILETTATPAPTSQ